jgi:hypothetical protein
MNVRRIAAVVSLVIVSAVAGGAAVAVTTTQTVSTCTAKAKAVRVLGTTVKCRSGERKVTWNARGPAGPTAVVNPFKGATIMVAGTTCPTGTTRAFPTYGAVDTLADSFGTYPYRVQVDSFGTRLAKDQTLLSMSACTMQ